MIILQRSSSNPQIASLYSERWSHISSQRRFYQLCAILQFLYQFPAIFRKLINGFIALCLASDRLCVVFKVKMVFTNTKIIEILYITLIKCPNRKLLLFRAPLLCPWIQRLIDYIWIVLLLIMTKMKQAVQAAK